MKNHAQVTIEAVVIIMIVVAALIAVNAYIRRGIQGKIKGSSGQISDSALYSPGATVSSQAIARNIIETANSYYNFFNPDTHKFTDTVENRTNDNRITISDSTTTMDQNSNQVGGVLSSAQEPQR